MHNISNSPHPRVRELAVFDIIAYVSDILLRYVKETIKKHYLRSMNKIVCYVSLAP